jgi:hypothetical protein
VQDSGDEGAWLLQRLALLLAPLRPDIWEVTGGRAMPGATKRRLLAGDIGEFPRNGCHVFVGLDVDCSDWIERTDPERVIVFCQPAAPSECLDQLRAISRDGARCVDLVFPSQAMAARFGTGHVVVPPPIDCAARAGDIGRERPSARTKSPGFATGLVGRNWHGTSPSADAEFLRRVGASSGTLEIYDPGQLRYVLGAEAAVRFSERSTAVLRRFVASVDCMLHVGSKWWLEGDGRELFMAMAAGTPVVCPRTSIFAEYIEHDVDGLLYDEAEEAIELVDGLRRVPARVVALGDAARVKIAALVAPPRVAEALHRLVVGTPSSLGAAGSGPVRHLAVAK